MEKGDKTKTNKVIFHFTEEKNTILEKINFFKYKEKIETNYVCDIYGEFGYARQKNENLDALLKELIWRIFDNDKQAYEITIVRTPKMDELFQKVIHSFSLRGIKYRVIEERETKNVMPMRRG
ncbi:hypothetical protein DXA62_14075 [Coprobacillus sp. OF03-2AA]|nr:hypothetical protein DXA62_14075 [Coprobacillus sp. OF03-2AA]